MSSFVMKVFLFAVIIYEIRGESEKKFNLLLAEDRRNSYEAWSNLVKIMQTVLQNSSPVKTTDTPPINIDDLLELELQGRKEYRKNIENDASVCSSDINYVVNSLREQWAIRMIDSYGKLGSGLLEGNFAWAGSYDECVKVHSNSTERNFQGKYCTINWSIRLPNTSPIGVSTGACVPSTCSASELPQEFAKILHIAGTLPYVKQVLKFVNITSINNCKPLTKELTTPAIFMICLVSFFGVMALLGSSVTIYDYFQNISKKQTHSYFFDHKLHEKDEEIIKTKEGSTINSLQATSDEDVLIFSVSQNNNSVFKKLKPILKSFCVLTNGAKILNTDAGEGQLLCIHGIRFLSMTWVILGHTYAFVYTAASVANPVEAMDEIDNVAFQIVFQGFYSVDSFFVLSGFLLTYLFFKEMTKTGGKMSWVYFYVHRYVRLTPVYMILLGLSATLARYLASGPYAPTDFVDEICEKYWWRNILYINNLFGAATMCMGWSWYLANDMQFYVISPFFLYALWRKPKIGFSIIGSLLVITTITNWVLTYEYNLFPGMSHFSKDVDFKSFMLSFSDYFDRLYIKPYARIGPYLIGVLLGYVVFKYKRSLSMLVLFFGWIIASLLTLLVIYGLYHTNTNVWSSTLYNAFGRIGFSLGLSWVIYVCLTNGGPVNQILSFKGFIPLSRLTYCAYLVHPIIIIAYYQNIKHALVFSHITMVALFFAFIAMSYAVAFVATLLFESPIMGLEKEVKKLFTKPRTQEISTQQ